MPITVREAAEQFAAVLTARGKAASYVAKQYGRLAGRGGFADACRGATMDQVDHDCITHWFAGMTTSTGDRNNKLVALRTFLEWAQGRKILNPEYTAAELLDGYKHREPTRTPKTYLEAGQFGELLDLAGEHHPRDRAIVALGLYTFVRQSEVALMKLADLDPGRQSLMVYRRKTRRYTEAPVGPELAAEMTTWLTWYARHTNYISADAMITAHPEWCLVPAFKVGGNRRQLSRLNPARPVSDTEEVVKAVLVKMGYTDPRQEGGHTLRRSGARELFLHLRDSRGLGHDGAGIWVQEMLDHKTLKQTMGYICVDKERDAVHAWVRNNPMFGTRASGGNVVQFPAAQ